MVHHEILHESGQYWKMTKSSKSSSVCSTHKGIQSGSFKNSWNTSNCIYTEQWSSQKGWCTQRCSQWMKVLQKSIIISHYEIPVSKNHHPWISQTEELFWCCDQSSNRREADRDEITAFWNQWSCCNHEACCICNHKVTITWMKHRKNEGDSWGSECKPNIDNCHNSMKCEHSAQSLRLYLNNWSSLCNKQSIMVTECLKSYSIIFISYVNKLSWCYRQTRLANHCTSSQWKCCVRFTCFWCTEFRWKISLSFSACIKYSDEFL